MKDFASVWAIQRESLQGAFIGALLFILGCIWVVNSWSASRAPAVFDVPALVGKDIYRAREVLGTPDYFPKQDRKRETWECSWEKAGFLLKVRYEVRTGRLEQFFINSAADSAGDEALGTLKAAAGVVDSAPEYRIVEVVSGPQVAFAGIHIFER